MTSSTVGTEKSGSRFFIALFLPLTYVEHALNLYSGGNMKS